MAEEKKQTTSKQDKEPKAPASKKEMEVKETEVKKEAEVKKDTPAPKPAEKKKSTEKEKAVDNKCPACGAPIFLKPKTGKWECEYCGSSFSLEELKKHNNASSDKNNEQVAEEDKIEYDSYKCQNCGAEIVADENTAATFCVYCGSVAILKSKLTGNFAPDIIIPFSKEKSDAEEAFVNLAKGRPLVPKSFTNKENIEKIRGVYIPFWLHSIMVSGELNSRATKVTSWRSGDYSYTKTDYYELLRSGDVPFVRVPVDGSSKFDNAIMNSIEPFDYSKIVKYNHAYLSGFYAEKYDVIDKDTEAEADGRAIESARDVMYANTSGYTTRSVTKDTLQAKETGTEYALFPVWMVSVKYEGKNYIFAMNGQSGKFIGNIPIDKKKQMMYSIVSFLVVFAIVFLICVITYLFTRTR